MITNKKIKELVAMQSKSKERVKANAFLVEGTKMFMEAPDERIREIYVSESFFAEDTVKQKLSRHQVETVPVDIFKKISDTQTPQGILCVLDRFSYTLNDMMKEEHPLFMILEDIQDPGNLGTILRTGEGAGVSGVILSKGCVDIYNPKTIRSTMGSVYRMPFLYTDDLAEVILQLKAENINVYAAHLKGEKYYHELSYWDKKGCAFLIGNEGNGLKKETADLADTYLKIPMEGKVESLNAAIASAILMYEAHKQKSNK